MLGDLTLVRPLGMAGIPVILATSDPHDEARRSRHVGGACELPGFEEPHRAASAEILFDLGATLHRRLGRKVPLVYGSDYHLDLLYEHRGDLAEHYLFTLNHEPLARALHDKERFYQLAQTAGIRVPRTCQSGRGLAQAMAEMRGPFLVKPRRKGDWSGIQRSLFDGRGKARVFPTREALLAHPAFARLENELIVQEHIESDVSGLVSFHAFADERGEILASFCGRKLRTWPRFAGESSFIELTADASVAAAGRDIAARLGLQGPFKIDLIRDAQSGELYVLEINARFNLWHYLGAVHGVNLPEVAYEHQVHGRRAAASQAVSPRYRWLDLYRDYHAFREQHAERRLGAVQWLRSLGSPRNVYGVFAWDDPAPFLQWTVSFLVRRCASGTLWDRLGHPR